MCERLYSHDNQPGLEPQPISQELSIFFNSYQQHCDKALGHIHISTRGRTKISRRACCSKMCFYRYRRWDCGQYTSMLCRFLAVADPIQDAKRNISRSAAATPIDLKSAKATKWSGKRIPEAKTFARRASVRTAVLVSSTHQLTCIGVRGFRDSPWAGGISSTDESAEIVLVLGSPRKKALAIRNPGKWLSNRTTIVGARS